MAIRHIEPEPAETAADTGQGAPGHPIDPEPADAPARPPQPHGEGSSREREGLPSNTIILAPTPTAPPMRCPGQAWGLLVSAVDIIDETNPDREGEVVQFAGCWVPRQPGDGLYDGDLVVRLTSSTDTSTLEGTTRCRDAAGPLWAVAASGPVARCRRPVADPDRPARRRRDGPALCSRRGRRVLGVRAATGHTRATEGARDGVADLLNAGLSIRHPFQCVHGRRPHPSRAEHPPPSQHARTTVLTVSPERGRAEAHDANSAASAQDKDYKPPTAPCSSGTSPTPNR